jgi:hypothetical protein
MEQRPSWESNQFSANQEVSRSVYNPKVHYRICNARHLSLCWARSIQCIPHHLSSWRSILILSYHLRLGLPIVFPSGFSTKTLCTPLLSPNVLHAPPILFFSIWSPEQYLQSLSQVGANYLYSAGSAFGSRPEQRFSWHVFHYFLQFQANYGIVPRIWTRLLPFSAFFQFTGIYWIIIVFDAIAWILIKILTESLTFSNWIN